MRASRTPRPPARPMVPPEYGGERAHEITRFLGLGLPALALYEETVALYEETVVDRNAPRIPRQFVGERLSPAADRGPLDGPRRAIAALSKSKAMTSSEPEWTIRTFPDML